MVGLHSRSSTFCLLSPPTRWYARACRVLSATAGNVTGICAINPSSNGRNLETCTMPAQTVSLHNRPDPEVCSVANQPLFDSTTAKKDTAEELHPGFQHKSSVPSWTGLCSNFYKGIWECVRGHFFSFRALIISWIEGLGTLFSMISLVTAYASDRFCSNWSLRTHSAIS